MPPIGRLHLITDTRPGRDVLSVVAASIAAGADTIQVRVPDDATDREAFELTVRVLGLCRASEVTCLVNDRLHVALAAGADGGHVGADDLPVAAARRVLGPHAIVGAPAHISDDLADARDQVRWFPAMVSNHVMDLIERYGTDGSTVPTALTATEPCRLLVGTADGRVLDCMTA